jgi:hypothetical protein
MDVNRKTHKENKEEEKDLNKKKKKKGRWLLLPQSKKTIE